ncbi:hypothetical protein G9A89_009199 [Geosiphon pyriformis]|nr:hypothetical protein G9A89_009199 [Geosiphon pyriformis]
MKMKMFQKVRKPSRIYQNHSPLEVVPKISKTSQNVHLPPEIIQKILGCLDERDVQTLYSCVILNRIWCNTTVETLWKRPFHLSLKPSTKLIIVCFTFLDDSQKAFLEINNHIHSKHSKESWQSPAAYDYPKYMRELDISELNEAIEAWRPSDESQYLRMLNVRVLKHLFRLFISRATRLEVFKFDVRKIFMGHELQFFTSMRAASKSLQNLKSFSCRTSKYQGQLLDGMLKFCTNLETIQSEGDNPHDNDHLGPLIRAQSSLKRFILDHPYPCTVLTELKTQASSLTYVKIKNCDLRNCDPLTGIAACRNLETISFENCLNLTSYHLKPLAHVQFPHLKQLEFIDLTFNGRELPVSNFISILKNAEQTLNNLGLGLDRWCGLRYPDFFENILVHCKTIRKFTISIHATEEILICVKFLHLLSQLEELVINRPNSITTNLGEILNQIAKFLPSTLKRLDFNYGIWQLTHKSLRKFLLECSAPLERLEFDCEGNLNWKLLLDVLKLSNGGKGYLMEMRHSNERAHLNQIVARICLDFR